MYSTVVSAGLYSVAATSARTALPNADGRMGRARGRRGAAHLQVLRAAHRSSRTCQVKVWEIFFFEKVSEMSWHELIITGRHGPWGRPGSMDRVRGFFFFIFKKN